VIEVLCSVGTYEGAWELAAQAQAEDPEARSAALVLALATPNERSHIVARKKQTDAEIQSTVESSVLAMPIRQEEEAAENGAVELKKDADSVDDDVEKNSTEVNQKIVDAAITKPGEDQPEPEKPEKVSEPKPKQPTTGEVAGAWMRNHADGTKTLDELKALAAKQNPAKFDHPTKPGRKVPYSTKQIIEMNKVGKLMPGNASGFYFPESIDSRKGGVEILVDEKTRRVSLKK
jgi:hypothetical protein